MSIGNGVEGLSKRSFSAKLACCQVSGGLTGHGGGQTGWRSDRSLAGGQTGRGFSVSFELGQKIEGVGKRGGTTTLGPIIFGVSRQKFYWFENSSRFSVFQA